MSKPICTWSGHIPGDPIHDLILAYLTMDIQKSTVWTAELLQNIHAVMSGALASWERSGNAYCLYIYPDHVEIENDYSDVTEQKVWIPIETFLAAVLAWQQMIKADQAKLNKI